MLLRIMLVSSLFLFFSSLYAQNEESEGSFIDYIDKKQEVFSNSVIDFFSDIDEAIDDLVNEPKEPLSYDALEKKLNEDFLNAGESVDIFFKSEKYMDET